MAQVKIIGKVGVKVMPDTSDFKNDLKDKLRKIQREIGDLEVDVVPQISKAAKDKVKGEFDRLVKDMDGRNVNINLDLGNDKKVRAEFDRLTAHMNGKGARIDVNVNKAQLAATEALLDELARTRKATIKVDTDGSALRKIGDSLLMLGGVRPQIDAVREAVEKLGRLDYVAINVGLTAVKMTLLAGAALAASGQVLSLGGSIAKIIPASLALPGILGGMAIGVTALAVVMKDFNKYVPEFAIGLGRSAKAGEAWAKLQNQMSANFWEKAAQPIANLLSTLFPQFAAGMRKVSTELGNFTARLADAFTGVFNGALAGMFKNLSNSIAVFSNYVGNLANLIKVLGEAGAAYLPSLARWFGEVLKSWDAGLSKAASNGSLTRWINDGITNLQALGSVIAQTSRIFYGLYTAARDAGGATLVSLAANLKDIANTVNSDGFQNGMTRAFKTAFDMMRNIANQAGPGFKAFILSLADSFNKVGPGLAKGIGGLIGELGKALASPSVGNGITSLFQGISNAIGSIGPTIKPTVEMLASLGPVFGALITNIAVIGANGMNRFSDTVQGLSKAIVPIINKLGSLFSTIGDAMIPVFKVMAENTTKAVTAFGPLIDAVHRLWNVIGPLLVPVLKIVVEILGSALVNTIHGVTMVIDGLVKIVTGVVDVFKGLWKVISGLFTGDFSKIGDGFKQIFGGLGKIILGALEGVAGAIWAWLNGSLLSPVRTIALKLGSHLLSPFTKFLAPLGRIFGKAIDAIKPFFNWIVKGAEDGVSSLGGIFSRIVDVIKWPFQKAIDAVAPIFNALKSIVEGAFSVVGTIIKTYFEVWWKIIETAFTVVKTIFEAGWSVVKTVFTTAFDVIKTVVTSAWAGIVEFFRASLEGLYFIFKGPWDSISTFLLTLWTNIKVGAMMIWNALKSFLNTMLQAWIVRFQDAWNAIRNVTTTVWNAVKGFITSVWNAIKGVFTSVLNAIKSFVSSIWNSVKSNTSSMWDSIKSKISSIWDAIKSAVSNAINAVKNTISSIWSSVRSNTESVWNSVSSKISGAWGSIKSAVSSAAGTVKSTMSNAWDSVRSTVVSAWNAIVHTVSGKVGEVIGHVRSIPGKALAALGSLGGLLVNAGQALIGGLISGITSKLGELKAKLSAVTNFIKEHKGPPEYDKVLLTPAGQMIMDSLIAGLESRYKDVKDSLQGLTNDIAGSFDSGQKYRLGVTADLSVDGKSAASIGNLSKTVSASVAGPAAPADTASIHIDNITIPLEDLKQLNTLEDFLSMLRVRSRQGVLA